MFQEPPVCDSIQYFIFEGVCACMCSAIQNALYFMLGLNTWCFHFMHYLFIFLILNISNLLGYIPMKAVSWRETVPLVATQLGATIATGIICSGGHEGGLYTLRLTDFATTIFILVVARHFTDPTTAPVDSRKPLVVFIAVFSSLAWLEFSVVDASATALLATPLLVVASALHRLLFFQRQQRLGCHMDELLLLTSGLTSALLAGPALVFTSDSFTAEMIGTATAWELVDYVLLALGVVFMVGLTYARYWLMANLAPETHIVLVHAKFTLASIGQWALHHIAQATVFSVLGKVLALGGICAYAYVRLTAHRKKNHSGHILLNS